MAELARLLAEAEAAEDRFRGLLEAAPDAMVIAKADGEIVLANQQAEKVFGYTQEELAGRAVQILVPGRFQERHVEHRADYQRAPRTRPMGAGLALWGRHKDGSEFPVEISLSPFERRGETLVSAAIRDISARRSVESAVERQAALLDLAPTAIVVRDPWSAIQYWNAAAERMYGWTAAEVRGQITHTLRIA